ncbi:hypothetical protein LP420_18365 [Massilia sp. B-10]|nr:hypothetical protein LP420_18365 [Massilia sp. B-10]
MADDIFNTPEPAWGSGAKRGRAWRPSRGRRRHPAHARDGHHRAAVRRLPDRIPGSPADRAGDRGNHDHVRQRSKGIRRTDAAGSPARCRPYRLHTVWWMLFDLYQVMGRQDEFDNVAIDYASQFETSPPTWAPPVVPGAEESNFA